MAKSFIVSKANLELVEIAASKKAAIAIVGDNEDLVIISKAADINFLDDEQINRLGINLGGADDEQHDESSIIELLQAKASAHKEDEAAPKAPGALARCRELFQEVVAQGGGRKEVMEKGEAMGLNRGTLATQWQKYRKETGLGAVAAA
jgi:hypothetical protein